MAPHDYGLLYPLGLVTAVLLVLLGVLEWRSARLRAAARAILSLPTMRGTALGRLCGVVVMLLLVMAVSRPFWGSEDIETSSSGTDVLFLVDISRSMYAQDVPPSRIELAKRKMKDLVKSLSSDGSAARFGITVFAGDGYTVCPVTTDRGVLAQFIDLISPDLVTSLGSNLKAGIVAALGRLDEAALRHTRIILISDGEDNFLDQTTIVRDIRTKGVRVDALGVGTPTGASIILPNGATVIDGSRKAVVSVLNEGSLRAIADAGGGLYLRATLDDGDIATLAQRSLPSGIQSATHTSQIRTYREYGPWLVVCALLLLICSALSRRINPLLSITVLVALADMTAVSATTPPPAATPLSAPLLAYSQFESYRRGDFQKAVEEYSQALVRSPHNRSLQFGLASSLYRLGRHEESAKAFRQLADSAQTGREYFENTYNEGNALLAMGRFSDAIDAYWKALDVKPDDPAALHNLAIARARLEEQKRATSTPTATPTATPAASPQPQPSPSVESSPSPQPDSQNQTQTPASPSPAASQSPALSPSAPPSAAASPAESPAATASAEATAAPLTPAGTPSASPPSSDEPQPQPTPEERLKESADPTGAPENQAALSPTAESARAIPEADAWLESLPDSPLLIRRYRGTPSAGGQTW